MSLRVSSADRARAVALGLACHLAFGVAIAWMIASLHEGMRFGLGRLTGSAAWLANSVLALSFPVVHSLLLTPRGQRALDRVSPGGSPDLRCTTYALVASLHLGAVFALWSPAGAAVWRATGAARVASDVAYGASWLLLGKAMLDAGLGVQTGWLGWSAVARGHRPRFAPFPTHGLFRFTRQPVYVAFACTLWTAPIVTADRLLLATLWTAYCVVGPLHKEQRLLARERERYLAYQRLVPYWLPRLARRAGGVA